MKPPLVIVLGMKAHEQKALITILESWGTPPEMLPTVITNESGQNKDRAGTIVSIHIHSKQLMIFLPELEAYECLSLFLPKSCTKKEGCFALPAAFSLSIS